MIARAIGKDPVWVVAALLAQHALTTAEPEIVGGADFGSGGRLAPRNSEESNAGYPESGCGDDGKNDGCGRRLLVRRPWQQSPPVPTTRPRSRPAYPLATLIELMISFGAVAKSCRSPAVLHEQVSEREIRTGRKVDQRNDLQIMLQAELATMKW